MNCNQCKTLGIEKEVTSPNITGELCTSCYFAKRNGSLSLAERATIKEPEPEILLGTDEPQIKEEKPTHYICDDCGEPHLIPDSNKEKVCTVKPTHFLDNKKAPNDGKKYCQSCLERGFGLKLATRMWEKDYFICEECYEPLLKNVLGVERAELEKVKTEIRVDSPALTQFYDLLQIPEPLRFTSSDHVLNHRNDIFNHHAIALVNVSKEQVESKIELLQVMLFQIKENLVPLVDYINKVKANERAQNNISSITKGREQAAKGPSKVKLTAMEKEAKSFGMSLEKYQEMVKVMKQREFDKVVGTSSDSAEEKK